MFTLTQKHLRTILRTQARFANVPFRFFKPIFEGKRLRKRWYSEHFWSSSQEKEFSRWLAKYFMKIFKIPKSVAEQQAAWWILGYGWTIGDYERTPKRSK